MPRDQAKPNGNRNREHGVKPRQCRKRKQQGRTDELLAFVRKECQHDQGEAQGCFEANGQNEERRKGVQQQRNSSASMPMPMPQQRPKRPCPNAKAQTANDVADPRDIEPNRTQHTQQQCVQGRCSTKDILRQTVIDIGVAEQEIMSPL